METNRITFEDLRALIARADALAHATAELFDSVVQVEAVSDRRSLERLAQLVGAAADATTAAVEAGEQLAAENSHH
jgi:hypothetical protein